MDDFEVVCDGVALGVSVSDCVSELVHVREVVGDWVGAGIDDRLGGGGGWVQTPPPKSRGRGWS